MGNLKLRYLSLSGKIIKTVFYVYKIQYTINSKHYCITHLTKLYNIFIWKWDTEVVI